MKLKEMKSIIILPIAIFLGWLYWQVIQFNNAISSTEERMEPEIEHPKQFADYIIESPLYFIFGLVVYLVWRIVRAYRD